MTRFDPSLSLRRMVIEKGGSSVYDERFHAGVNIVRGENSSGKSTILNFIHYGLGGDVHEWSETALLCDRVTVEVFISGKVVTLSRLVSNAQLQPMEIFFGPFEESTRASRAQWERYPYRRSEHRESFSQVLFRLLEVPEAASEDSGNITVHQVMRLLYADQLSPVEDLFAHERFDNAKLREAVGKLLCGAFDSEMYSNELEIRATDKRFNAVSSELGSLYKALGEAGHDLTLTWVEEQRTRNEAERVATNYEIVRIQTESPVGVREVSLHAQNYAHEQLVDRQRKLAHVRSERDGMELSIADSAAFIRSLEDKQAALKDAALVAQELGGAHFSSCPACYSEMQSVEPGICVLCKEPFDPELGAERIGALINDVTLQLRQSRLLQEDRLGRLANIEASLANAESEWKWAAQRYEDAQSKATSQHEHQLSQLYKRIGYLDRQDEDLDEKARLIEIVSSLSAQKAELNHRLSMLRERNEQLLHGQRKRLDTAYLAISDKVRSLLAQDIRRQDSFENPQKVAFSFTDNRISVDGHTYFSASSRAILKSAFFLGFHEAATTFEFFRHPRFLMLDTIEDKGMEPVRSQNFQRLIVRASERGISDNQIIFATAMIAAELDTEEFVVGRFYTRENRALEFS